MIRASRVSRPMRVTAMLERATAVDGAGEDLVARRLVDRQRLAGDRRLVDVAVPGDDDAVERHLVARPDDDLVADRDVVDRQPGARRRRA